MCLLPGLFPFFIVSGSNRRQHARTKGEAATLLYAAAKRTTMHLVPSTMVVGGDQRAVMVNYPPPASSAPMQEDGTQLPCVTHAMSASVAIKSQNTEVKASTICLLVADHHIALETQPAMGSMNLFVNWQWLTFPLLCCRGALNNTPDSVEKASDSEPFSGEQRVLRRTARGENGWNGVWDCTSLQENINLWTSALNETGPIKYVLDSLCVVWDSFTLQIVPEHICLEVFVLFGFFSRWYMISEGRSHLSCLLSPGL